jgi:esterase/lipase superfamily enzyme
LFRAAQIAYDLKFDGPVFVYSWPSAGSVSSYTYDRESASQAEPYFRKFLETIARDTGAGKIHLVAHSMGNQLLINALAEIKTADSTSVRIGQVIFAAPDVDPDLFAARCAQIAKDIEGATVYAASNDTALLAASKFWGNPRAGDVGAGGPFALGLCADTIDISAADSSSDVGIFKPSFLLADMSRLLKTGTRPPDKRSPELKAVQTDKGVFWRYEPR